MDLKKMVTDKLKSFSHDKLEDVNLGDYNLDEVLNDEFISKFTDLSSVAEFIQKSGFGIEKIQDMTNIPMEQLNGYIQTISKFKGWEDMIKKAIAEFLIKQ